MYVCLCKAVTDKQIREAVCGGMCQMRDLRNCFGLATQCGRCGKASRNLIEETLKELQTTETMSDNLQDLPELPIVAQADCSEVKCANASN